MRSIAAFNHGWMFHDGFDAALVGELRPGRPVTLPHNAVDLPFNYFDDTAYQRPFAYQKTLA